VAAISSAQRAVRRGTVAASLERHLRCSQATRVD